jgi:hypothetical protein
VHVTGSDADTVTFTESGTWTSDTGEEFDFKNILRWSRANSGKNIRLEHLRSGPESPVHLFDLAPEQGTKMRSIKPHVCGEDLYSAEITAAKECIELRITVKGPKKDEQLCCFYKSTNHKQSNSAT